MSAKILHIFHDDKFIDIHIFNIQEGNFQNTFVYLKDELTYNGEYRQLLKHIIPHSSEYNNLIKDCQNHHILILYYLSIDKADIVLKLKKNRPIIIWSFYGGDLYSLPEVNVNLLTKETLDLLTLSQKNTLTFFMKSLLRPLFNIFGRYLSAEDKIRKAISHINYFTWYDKGEYDFLNGRLKNKLPAFIESSVSVPFDLIDPIEPKSNCILIGNSASPYNNHINIIDILQKYHFSGKVYLPVSYGNQPPYLERIKAICNKTDLNMSFLSEFISYKDYINLINQQSATIFNSYRQMALGNILMALKCGAKVYLSLLNPSFQWLKKIGFFIYSIENDLIRDIDKNDIRLSEEYMKENILKCRKIGDGYSNRRFLNQIRKIAEENKRSI